MARDVYRELLELAAFEGEELETALPEIKKTLDKLKVYEDDVRYAVDDYIPRSWDIKYLGIRKMIGAFLRELIDVIKTPEYKAQGKKIVYGIMPAITNTYFALKYAGGDDVFISFPDALLVQTLQGFFGKGEPWYMKSEQDGMNYGCRHCGLNKMRYAAYLNGLIAAPDCIWSWGFNCDEGPKTDEMIQCMTGNEWHYVVSRAPHDTQMDEVDCDLEKRVKFASKQIRTGFEEVQRATGIEVLPEHFAAANKAFMGLNLKLNALTHLVATADPPVLSADALTMLGSILFGPFNTGIGYIEDAIVTLTKEVKADIKAGVGIAEKGAPRLAIYNAVFSIPGIDKLFRENGCVLSLTLMTTLWHKQMEAPKYTDIFDIAAEQWMRSSNTMNVKNEALANAEKIKANMPLDGVILGFFDFDRWMGAQHKMMAPLIEQEVGIPVYYIEGDSWDSREYNEETLRTKVESICQIVKMRKLQEQANG